MLARSLCVCHMLVLYQNGCIDRAGFCTQCSISRRKPATGSQPNFARCLAVCWVAGILYIHFRGLLPPIGILPGAKFTFAPKFCVLLFWQHYCTALEQWASTKFLRHGTSNRTMELSLLIIFNRGRHLYSEGGHHVGHRPAF